MATEDQNKLSTVRCTFSTTEGATVGKFYKTKWLGHLGMQGVETNNGTFTPIKLIHAVYEEDNTNES